MDVKCVRVLRIYEGLLKNNMPREREMVIYVDKDARYALNRSWGSKVEAKGRRVIEAIIQPLDLMDQDGFIARADQTVIDALYIEYGEEILLK